jgi:hypothetical protein
MPISNGILGMPEIASDGIQVMDVTDDSMRTEPSLGRQRRDATRARASVQPGSGYESSVPRRLRQNVSAPAITLTATHDFFEWPEGEAALFALRLAAVLLSCQTLQPSTAFLRLSIPILPVF